MNAANVILPSSQYSPDSPYECQTWVFNGGAYVADNYNKILGTPADDADGHKWYDPEYQLTVDEGNSIAWQLKPSPYYDDDNGAVQSAGYGWTAPGFTADFYGRRTFTLNEELPLENIILACGHDDAPCEYYINGVLVVAVNDGWENGMWRVLSDEHKALIKTDGTENVLAFHVHQNWGGAFADCGLYWADMRLENVILASTQDVKEQWPCEYFFPIDNDDLDYFESDEAQWYKPGYNFEGEDGCEWTVGVGPLCNDGVWNADEEKWEVDENGDFLRGWNGVIATYWNGGEAPLMVRRYFNLTANDIEALSNGAVMTLSCSYDEDPNVYINGEFVCHWDKWNDGNYASHTLTADQIATLKEGENLIAVSLRSGEGGCHIDMGLKLSDKYNPAAGIENVAADNKMKINDNRIFDLQGRFVGTDMEKLGRGIYIKGGKKVLINK